VKIKIALFHFEKGGVAGLLNSSLSWQRLYLDVFSPLLCSFFDLVMLPSYPHVLVLALVLELLCFA